MKRTYVTVDCRQYNSGAIKPLRIHWHDGRVWEISRLLHSAYPTDDEFKGVRYTVLIGDAEAGHYLLCRHNPEQTVPSYRRTFDAEREYTKREIEEMFSLNEFWADKMAACLLMPDFIVKKAVSKYYKNKRIAVYGNSIFAPKDKIRLRKMADEIGVSFSALIIRLKHLNYVEHHETSEYIDKYLQVGESI